MSMGSQEIAGLACSSVFVIVVVVGLVSLYLKKGGGLDQHDSPIEQDDDPYAAAMAAHNWEEMMAGDLPLA